MTRRHIDKGILPLVDALNNINGVKTRFSCEGHSNDEDAYVMFTVRDIRTLKRVLKKAKCETGLATEFMVKSGTRTMRMKVGLTTEIAYFNDVLSVTFGVYSWSTEARLEYVKGLAEMMEKG